MTSNMTGTMKPSLSISADKPSGVITYITPNIITFQSQRGKTVDNDPYSSFNVCPYTGDTSQHVEACRNQLCNYLNISPTQLIVPRQTHSCNVKIIDSLPVNDSDIYNIDALVTALPDVALAINTADCVPILLADPTTGIIGAAHSGWKGTMGRISQLTVDAMVKLGADISTTKAIMGTCICGDCFEVGDEVVDQFRDNGFNDENIILKRLPRNHIDLSQACRLTLIQAGIKPENISLPQYCSRCNPTEYFSARRLGINSGRTLSLIIRYND